MANSTLNRTFGTPTHADKWTWSAWIKRSKLSSSGVYMDVFAGYTDGNNYAQLSFHPDNYFFYYDYQGGAVKASLATNKVFRDTSSWYHIIVATDTTQGTAADRVKLYINGEQYTWDRTTTYPNQNQDTKINNASTPHYIGQVGVGNFFDGYMSHVAFVDGQQLTPTSFGSTDSTSGIWKFKPPSGITWGTNGAHLKFENSANLGLDSSSNTNNWTVGGNLKQALDTPSNVYCTLNFLNKEVGGSTLSNGNTKLVTTAQGGGPYTGRTIATLGASSGKYYWEVKPTSTVSNTFPAISVVGEDFIVMSGGNYLAGSSGSQSYITFIPSTGNIQYNFTGSSTNASYGNVVSANDIIGVALDLDNGKIFFSINGTWQNSGNPATGANPANNSVGSLGGDIVFPAFGDLNYSSSATILTNFGNGYFGTTAITSAGSNGNGSLFEYDVPSGFYALNTKNINTYG